MKANAAEKAGTPDVLTLKEIAKAHRYMESNQASGKVVVVIEKR